MKTANVTLRRLKLSDAAKLFELIDTNRPQLQKFWWESRTQSVADSVDFIHSALTAERYDGRPTRGVFVHDTLVGVASVHTINWSTKTADIGYWIGAQYAGHGYATQAAKRISKLAFTKLKLMAVNISCRADNRASRSVAEKAGFELQGIDSTQHWHTHVDTPIAIAHYQLVKTS